MNDLVRPSMYDAYHDIIPVKEQKLGMNIKFDVVGPICETGDTFAKDRNLKVMSEGDLLAICSSGAYGAVMASEYNSRPLVPEVLVKGSKFSVIRPRPSMISIIDKDIIPEWLY
jgi:diaminopimelate decarboxylase